MMLLADAAAPLTILIFLVVAFLVTVALIYAAKAARRRDEMLQGLAQELGGKLHPSGLLSYPELHFLHRGLRVALKYSAGGEGEDTRTQLSIPWPDRSLRSEIFPEGPLSGLRKLIGMQDIEIGFPHFDRQFIITGNDILAIKAFLTPEAQARLFELLRVDSGSKFTADSPNLYLQIAAGWLRVTKTRHITDRAILENFIQTFLEFFDAATGASSEGIEFLQSAEPEGTDIPHCIVCGEALRLDLVTCRSCKTPHHKDCWQYFGGCATYACGGKQFVPAKASGGR